MNREKNWFNLTSLYTGKAVLAAVGYFLFGMLAIPFISTQNQLPLVWPQAGFALAAVLLIGYEALPGIFLGSFTLALATGVAVDLSAIVAFGNCLAAFFPAYYLLTKNNFSHALDNIGSIIKLALLGIVLSPVLSATISMLGMQVVGLNVGEAFLTMWAGRWLRDALGVLVFTPLLLVWLGNPLPHFEKKRVLESALIAASVIGLEAIIFLMDLNPDAASSITFLLVPIILWASLRLSIHGLVAINALASILFLCGAAHRFGGLFNGAAPSFPTFLTILATMWATSLILSASITKYNKVQRSLSDLSNHDTLTGLFNRLFFETELKRLDNSRQFPISIIMADLDNLKQVNDTFGHRAGDQLLKNLANLFNTIFRHEDIICRIGGDEFVVLLPNTGEPATGIILERLHKRIELFNKDHPDLPIRISIGVSTASQGEALLGHLKIADNLMYEEKARKKTEEPIALFLTTDRREKVDTDLKD